MQLEAHPSGAGCAPHRLPGVGSRAAPHRVAGGVGLSWRRGSVRGVALPAPCHPNLCCCGVPPPHPNTAPALGMSSKGQILFPPSPFALRSSRTSSPHTAPPLRPQTQPRPRPHPHWGERGAQGGCGVTSPSARAAGSAADPPPPGVSGAPLPPAPVLTAPWPGAAARRSWGTARWTPGHPPAPGPRGDAGLPCAGESWRQQGLSGVLVGPWHPHPLPPGGMPRPYQPVSPAALVRHGVGARLAVGQCFPNGHLWKVAPQKSAPQHELCPPAVGCRDGERWGE